MNIQELEEKLLEAVEKLELHLGQYEKDIVSTNSKIEKLRSDLDELWSTLRTSLILSIVMFIVVAITWFFPFQVGTYGYLSPDDVRRKTIAISIEALVFGILFLFALASTFLGRSRKE
ncbi:MAG TPA: hypothetical protein PKI14_02180 [Fervidobacterium sp.]|nr:hypothetical protein [Fervidobacterium sp.]HOK87685.1 hypothetical protein [Fervidobacterium sp.]HOM74014.1 hypothetical protein [Fervidobacterium sp.]HOQ39362.1 hypothetical protein [Fervidobacterium sp.]HPP17652.1 hypothetical protein [Fervidobacterium sp.]